MTEAPKAIFITGAAQGIGRATAELFARAGWHVGLCDVDEAGVQALGTALGPHAFAARVDVTQPGEVEAAVAAFVAKAGRLDVFFNNAGVLAMGPFDSTPLDKTLRMLDVNIRGVVLGARAAVPHLRTSRGLLVQMGSAAGIYGTADIAVYSATKFFVRGLTEALDVELADAGVRVVDIMPSFVDTAMVRRDQVGSRSVDKLGVHLQPADIAAVVWRAATTTTRGHVIPQLKMWLFARVAGIFPSLARALARSQGR